MKLRHHLEGLSKNGWNIKMDLIVTDSEGIEWV